MEIQVENISEFAKIVEKSINEKINYKYIYLNFGTQKCAYSNIKIKICKKRLLFLKRDDIIYYREYRQSAVIQGVS